MAQAHKATKAETIRLARDYRPGIFIPYRELFVHFLKKAHKEFKAMQVQAQKTIKLALIGSTFEANKDATWFSVEGTATDSEGNRVHIGYSGSTIGVQAEADWYFCSTNGFTNIDLYACVWGLEDVKESFKIIR